MTKCSTLTLVASAAIFSIAPHTPQAFAPSFSRRDLRHFHVTSPSPNGGVTSSSPFHHGQQRPLFSTESDQQETDAERMLRRARELLAEASAEEENLRASLIDKKHDQDKKYDNIIDALCPAGAATPSTTVVDQLRTKHLSTEMLTHVIKRLHEREITAKGLDHVEQASSHDHTTFKVVSSAEQDKEELARIEGLVEKIIDAAVVLDEEWRAHKEERGEKHVMHTEMVHWTAGNVADVLKSKVRDLRREHDEQFKKRQNEFYEAARRKDMKP
uniref:Uncharacterized protein n=1 Tax=Helicotheca tamesis TaxID=374047 RepID=A0A7S2MPW1_9STRA|mmetsp:Transcript_19610/g.26921  ORF Transcript_19610/g.26921 Transcript_19610/m.26921 type:complete len:272 (+) Transcript_19610:109-924(+)|eukprot:CAMPEP_0185729186 /NCGR_PEP_ID=MMETSP1171-20130828/4527_1 /TAXON_ID=374046 /ORGANISM="Helicotheca tamensis, Strain CCMP826" /LENGTH=271 /DNA_ID=CAMNT_0028397969 /DNA_START=37 /DNA_END=852 /DNA_ORIENTATION=-